MKFIIVLCLCLPACAQTWFGGVTKKPTTTSCAISFTTAVPTIAHIQYGLAAGSYTQSTANSTQFLLNKTETISGLKPGTTYHFTIVAADDTHDWIQSHDFTCITTKATTASKPTTASYSVKLNWQASSSGGVNAYEVYRSTISGGYFGLLAKVAGLSYTDQSVQPGDTYFYAVKAINTAGQLSSFSNQVKTGIP
jgi:predicted phage tail protein